LSMHDKRPATSQPALGISPTWGHPSPLSRPTVFRMSPTTAPPNDSSDSFIFVSEVFNGPLHQIPGPPLLAMGEHCHEYSLVREEEHMIAKLLQHAVILRMQAMEVPAKAVILLTSMVAFEVKECVKSLKIFGDTFNFLRSGFRFYTRS